MKQYRVTEEEAIDELHREIANAWKDLNKVCLRPTTTTVPMALLTRVVNIARVIDVAYKDEDSYTHNVGVLKDYIVSLLVDPVEM